MGLISAIKKLFFRKPTIEENDELEFSDLYLGQETYEKKLSENLDQVVDATYQMEDLRIEYELVTAYFSDIQRIEQLPENIMSEVKDIARKIQFLEKNRREFLESSEERLSDDRFKQLRGMEKEIRGVCDKLKDLESLDSDIRRDMQHLEGEKAALEYEEEEIGSSKKILQTVCITIAILAAITFGILAFLGIKLGIDIMLVLTIIALVVTICAVLIFLRYRKLEYDLKLCEAKQNKAITLLNKVKIKYINNTSTLDYMYEKYKVHSLNELMYNWEQYNIMLDEIKRYQQSTGDLKVYCEDLKELLKKLGIRDYSVWTKQTEAILNAKEMVEVKHELNVRRQKLRAALEYNEALKTSGMEEISKIIEINPGLKEYVRSTASTYHIEIE